MIFKNKFKKWDILELRKVRGILSFLRIRIFVVRSYSHGHGWKGQAVWIFQRDDGIG